MDPVVPGRDYELGQTLHEDGTVRICRGRRVTDDGRVLLKRLHQGAPPAAVTRLRHEFLLAGGLDLDGVCRILDLTEVDGLPTLVMSDDGGVMLPAWLTEAPELDARLDVAIGISRALARLHQTGIVHGDLNPDAILVHPERRQVRLMNLGLASLAAHRIHEPLHPIDLDGALGYLAPEQTGRLGRSVDRRADLYALGVCLYGLSAGRLPFESLDPLALVHAHLARTPPPVTEVDPTLPPALADIVARLLEKRPEDRYQDAASVSADLERIRTAHASGPGSGIEGGQRQDAATRFSLPQRWYGREQPRRRLLQFVERAAAGHSDLVLLTGEPGVGKSTLLAAACARARSRGFRSVRARYSRIPRPERAAPVVLAFATLIRGLLALPENSREHWRQRFEKTLGTDGAFLAEALPELPALLGPAMATPSPGLREAGQRFEQSFRKLVEAGSSPEAPLLVVLEGCEWIDPDSRRLLQRITGAGGVPHLLIIATAAEPALAATALGPLWPGPDRRRIALPPLQPEETRAFVADLLHQDEQNVTELARRVHAKGEGNPATILDALESLRAANLLEYQDPHPGWFWDPAAIAATPLLGPDTDLLQSRLGDLPDPTQGILELAACIGESFHARLLCEVAACSLTDVTRQLRPALMEGFVVPAGATGRWSGDRSGQQDLEQDDPLLLRLADDRVHRAVYRHLPSDERGRLHRSIGARLLESAGQAAPASGEPEQGLFLDAVMQFNLASTLPGVDQLASDELARLNLRAGRLALSSGQPQAAFRFLRTGMGQLGRSAWSRHPQLMADLSGSALDAAFLCADPVQVERLSGAAIAQARDPQVRLHMTAMLARACFAQGRIADGMAVALPELARHQLGLESSLPATASLLSLLWEAEGCARRWKAGRLQEAGDDPYPRTLSQLLLDVAQNAVHDSPSRVHAAARRILRLSRRHGLLPETPYALAIASAAAIGSGWIGLAGRLQSDAARLLDDGGTCSSRAAIRTRTLLQAYVQPRTDPERWGPTPLLAIFDDALGMGDLEGAGHAAAAFAAAAVLSGSDLDATHEQLQVLERTLRPYPSPPGLDVMRQYGRFVDIMRTPDSTSGDAAAGLTERGHPRALAAAHGDLLAAWQSLLDGSSSEALELLEPLTRNRTPRVPCMVGDQIDWLLALAATDRAAEVPAGAERRRLRRLARRARRRLEHRTGSARPRFEHRIKLLDAGTAILTGRDSRALDAFGLAIQAARTSRMASDEGLAWQRAAAFCRDHGRDALSRHFLQGARTAWQRWGAERRVHALVTNGEPLQTRSPNDDHEPRFDLQRPGPATSPDTEGLLAAARTIAGEVRLEELLRTLVGLVLDASGAERSFLILLEDARPLVTAAAAGDGTRHVLDPPRPLLECGELLPISVIQAVVRSREGLVIEEASAEDDFSDDSYVLAHEPRAIACEPLLLGGRLLGLLYMEHRRRSEAFGRDRMEVIRLLAAQAAIGIDNARLYAALALARDEYRDLFDHAAEGIFRTAPGGRLQRANLALAEALGYRDVDELLGGIRELPRDVAADPADAMRLLDRIYAEGQVQGAEIEGFHNDGSRTWFAISARLIRDDDGRPTAIEGSLIDVSERWQRLAAEREREVAQAATEAKSRFLARMSHEIRTPMNAILGFSELMLATDLESRQREFATTIHTAADSLLRLTNDILDFSSIEAGRLRLLIEPLDLAALLAELETLFASSARQKGLAFVCRGGDELRRTFAARSPLGDSGRLRQVLVNLLGNALKFTEQGRIELSIRPVAVEEDRAEIRFEVRDTGIGIASGDQARLFRSFEQIDSGPARHHGGTGLGLAICRELVGLMGSEIELESAPGRGSRFGFHLHLPLTQAEADGSVRPAALARGDDLTGSRILLAEDNRINQQLTVEFLQRAGAAVRVVDSGVEVLKVARDATFDAILMDLHMPGMDGIDACRALRSDHRFSTVPIIAVTADAATDSIARARKAGFDDYLLKPLTSAALVTVLARHLGRDVETTAEDAGRGEAGPARGDVRMPARMPGIDLQRALRHHNGDPDLLARLGEQFVTLYASAPATLAAELDAGEHERAIRLAHNLHGVAGSFGAERLRLASHRLEVALERRPQLDGAPMEEFRAALAEVIQSMQALASERRSG